MAHKTSSASIFTSSKVHLVRYENDNVFDRSKGESDRPIDTFLSASSHKFSSRSLADHAAWAGVCTVTGRYFQPFFIFCSLAVLASRKLSSRRRVHVIVAALFARFPSKARRRRDLNHRIRFGALRRAVSDSEIATWKQCLWI